MSRSQMGSRRNSLIALIALIAAAALSSVIVAGCYVVPVQPDGRPYQGGVIVSPSPVVAAQVIAPPPALPAVANLRLYPTNESASRIGVVSGQVVNMLDGRGQFSVMIASETFTGEATRSPGKFSGAKTNEGVASGAGNRGGFLTCQYNMSAPTQGVGTCSLSNGAEFRMHIGG